MVGFWDVVAFDEVAEIRVKDRDTMQIMKDYMANGRFSRGPAEITAEAGLAFVGNIDESTEFLVSRPDRDLFQPLYVRAPHQIANFVRFCELVAKIGSARKIQLRTASDDQMQEFATSEKFDTLASDLAGFDIKFEFSFDARIHDREIRLDNGWSIKIGRGLDYFQRVDRPRSAFDERLF
jgi:hypothetical protein